MLLEEFMLGLRLLAVALLLAGTFRAEAAEYDVPKDLDVTGPYTQEATGMVFPDHVLDF